MSKLKTISATSARSNIFSLIDDAAEHHEPILITSKRSNAVLVSEDDWHSIQETLYLLSVPGFRESVLEGKKTATDELISKDDVLKILDGDE